MLWWLILDENKERQIEREICNEGEGKKERQKAIFT
jgi:hypothetical protein